MSHLKFKLNSTHVLMKREVSQKFKTGEHNAEETKLMSLIMLWANQSHEEKTSALCPSLYTNHSETMGSTGTVSHIGFPRVMIGLMPVGSSFGTTSTHVWRVKAWERPSAPEPELPLQDGNIQSGGSSAKHVPASHPSHTLSSSRLF